MYLNDRIYHNYNHNHNHYHYHHYSYYHYHYYHYYNLVSSFDIIIVVIVIVVIIFIIIYHHYNYYYYHYSYYYHYYYYYYYYFHGSSFTPLHRKPPFLRDPCENYKDSGKFLIKIHLLSMVCIHKCHLQNIAHFCRQAAIISLCILRRHMPTTCAVAFK